MKESDDELDSTKNFQLYFDYKSVKKRLMQQKPLSGIMTEKLKYVIMLQDGEWCEMKPKKFVTERVGMNYFSWTCTFKSTMKLTSSFTPNRFILFLPLLQKSQKLQKVECTHTLITTEYETILKDMTIGFPEHPMVQYKTRPNQQTMI